MVNFRQNLVYDCIMSDTRQKKANFSHNYDRGDDCIDYIDTTFYLFLEKKRHGKWNRAAETRRHWGE